MKNFYIVYKLYNLFWKIFFCVCDILFSKKNIRNYFNEWIYKYYDINILGIYNIEYSCEDRF